MCGIAGLFRSEGEIRPGWIKEMTDALRHRGPDDEGFLAADPGSGRVMLLAGPDSQTRETRLEDYSENARLYLGHRRLSIIDLSALGHQPMSNRDGSVWIVFNGEIYNFLDLKRELEGSGRSFRSRTDTEVVLAGYEEWGEKILDRLDGMWSFAIYDATRKILFGARDRFGVKPFYYFQDDKSFVFASEIKALLRLPFVKRNMNSAAVFDFLALGLVENDKESFFQGIYELKPSTAFRLDLSSNEITEWKYYELNHERGWSPFQEDECRRLAANTREHVIRSVGTRLRSDVPIGSCLSGGIDSSTIVCIVNEFVKAGSHTEIGDKQKAFTVSYGGGKADETSWAGIVAKHTRLDWQREHIDSRRLVEELEDIVYAQDIPFLSTSVFSQYGLMKLVRTTGVKVLLDGQGGDELFAGYRGFYLAAFMEFLKRLKGGDLIREICHIGQSPVTISWLLRAGLKSLVPRLLPLGLLGPSLEFYRKDLKILNREFWAVHQSRLKLFKEKTLADLNKSLSETLTSSDFSYLLRYEDRNSMHFSIEARTPFADDRALIEFAFRIPAVYKIHEGWSKYILRRSMEGILPEEIRWRRDKIGFATPERIWMKELAPLLQKYLTSDLSPYFNIDHLRSASLHLKNEGRETEASVLWRYIIFAVWMKVFGS